MASSGGVKTPPFPLLGEKSRLVETRRSEPMDTLELPKKVCREPTVTLFRLGPGARLSASRLHPAGAVCGIVPGISGAKTRTGEETAWPLWSRLGRI